VEELQHPERDNGKRIIRFRQHAFLLLSTQYTQVEVALKLGIDKTHFNKYYNDPETTPGTPFLNKFDEVFGAEIKALSHYLKTYKKDVIITKCTNLEYSIPFYSYVGATNSKHV